MSAAFLPGWLLPARKAQQPKVRTGARRDGLALALAWPETWCRQTDAWYNQILLWLGLNCNGYYQVGHAALLLIERESGKLSYFDFGRYESPVQMGRVRSAITDPALSLPLEAHFNTDGLLLNQQEICQYLSGQKACRGSGPLHCACLALDYQASLNYVQREQEKGFQVYGPFVRKGTNCARFVRGALVAGRPNKLVAWALRSPLRISPFP